MSVRHDTLYSVFLDGTATSGALVLADQPWSDAQTARFYDAFPFDADLPLYTALAAEQGGRILEVACGTGRVLVPLARAGFDVVGVDVSPHMLDVCRAKLGNASAQLVEADMRSFHLPDAPFDLAIVAVKSFAYLVERHEQLQCLRTIAAHLRAGGVLTLDLLHPRPEWVATPVGWLRDDLVQADHEGKLVTRVESVVRTDLARQVRVIRSIYEVIDRHGRPVEKRIVEWPYRFTYRFEAEHLLERAGFRIESLFGGYEREPFTAESKTMLFVARKL